MSASDVTGWAAGDAVRKKNEASSPLQGEDHPHAHQIFILMGIVALLLALATKLGWNPFGYLGWMWSDGDLYWTVGTGLGVGVIMYFIFSLLE